MSDILDRLVRFSKHKQCMSTDLEVEAAAEITRLREEVARLREETDGGTADDCKSCGCQYESWKAHYQRLTIQNAGLGEENARLREAVKAAYYEGWQDNASIEDTEDRLHAEGEHSEACAAIRETSK